MSECENISSLHHSTILLGCWDVRAMISKEGLVLPRDLYHRELLYRCNGRKLFCLLDVRGIGKISAVTTSLGEGSYSPWVVDKVTGTVERGSAYSESTKFRNTR